MSRGETMFLIPAQIERAQNRSAGCADRRAFSIRGSHLTWPINQMMIPVVGIFF